MSDGKNKSFLYNLAKKFFDKDNKAEENNKENTFENEEATDLSDMPQLISLEGDMGSVETDQQLSDDEAMQQLRKLIYGEKDDPVEVDFNDKTSQEEPAINVTKEKLPPLDSKLSLEIAPDTMSAHIYITPPENGGKDVTVQDILALINSKHIFFGIDLAAIKEAVDNKIYNTKVQIAQGVHPVKGKDGYIEEVVKISESKKGPKERNDGTLDFKELGKIINVEKGQLICRVHYPVPGVDGKNIMGKSIKHIPGREVPDPLGRNTIFNEDKTMVIASISGSVSVVGGKYNVSEVYKISGNVDSSTGNINFLGSVIVGGDVKEGFSIIATDEVRIAGVVEGAYIKSGADVKISQGINGMGKGVIIANGDVECKFIENCRIQAFGDVIAQSVVGANISCDNNLIVTEGKGVIKGGNYSVAGSITAKALGSVSNITTNIVLGISVTLSEQISNLKTEADTLLQEITKLNQVTTYFADLAKKHQLDQEKLALYNSAVYTHNEKVKVLQEKREQIDKMEVKLSESTKSNISLKDRIYPGVNITIGNFNTRIRNEIERPLIYLGQDNIVISEGGAK